MIHKKKIVDNITSILFCFIMFSLLIMPTLAADTTTVAGEWVAKIAQVVVPCFNSICVLAAGITIMQLLISKDQRTVNGAYKYMGIIFITFIIFNLLGSILLFVDKAVPAVSYNYSTNTVVNM